MVGSKTDVVNIALHNLGHTPILNFEDAGKAGELARSTYDNLRDAMMEEFSWDFCTRETAISADASTTNWRYSFAYTLPEENLIVLKVEDDEYQGYNWDVEGRKIVTDETSPINIVEVWRNEDVSSYNAMFIQALAARLSMEWAEPLAKATTLQKMMTDLYAVKVSKAKTRDSRQKREPDEVYTDTWLNSRY